MYEPQYHPKAELGNIFGSKTAKINNADNVADEDTVHYDENGLPLNIDTDQSAVEIEK